MGVSPTNRRRRSRHPNRPRRPISPRKETHPTTERLRFSSASNGEGDEKLPPGEISYRGLIPEPVGKPSMGPLYGVPSKSQTKRPKPPSFAPKLKPGPAIVTDKAPAKRTSAELIDGSIDECGPAFNPIGGSATLGNHPSDHAELYQRQLRAHGLGGLRPTMYNWLLFGRTQAQAIAGQVPVHRPSFGSAVDDQKDPRKAP